MHDEFALLSWLADAGLSSLGIILPFLFVITVLIFVHEMGHYLIGRLFKVGVEVFSIGFGPELYGCDDRNKTRWKLSIIPIGGYVRFRGEDEEDEKGKGAKKKRKSSKNSKVSGLSYNDISAWKRVLILFAGPAANLIFAIVAVALLFIFLGESYRVPLVSQVIADSPAERGGIMVGDTIVALDGRKVSRFSDIPRNLSDKAGKMIDITVRDRQGDVRHLRLTPDSRKNDAGQTSGFLGITSEKVAFMPISSWQGLNRALAHTAFISGQIYVSIYEIFAGHRSSKELGGPIRIAELSGQVWEEGGFSRLIFFMVLISINLAIINLFPIPPLDGGGIVLCLYEMAIGKAYLADIKSLLYRVGAFLIFALFVFVTWNDIAHLWNR